MGPPGANADAVLYNLAMGLAVAALYGLVHLIRWVCGM